MYELQYDPEVCARCETFDCLTRCQYMDLDLETAREERQRLLDGEDAVGGVQGVADHPQ